MKDPDILPQERRENVDPTEGHVPTPWYCTGSSA